MGKAVVQTLRRVIQMAVPGSLPLGVLSILPPSALSSGGRPLAFVFSLLRVPVLSTALLGQPETQDSPGLLFLSGCPPRTPQPSCLSLLYPILQ